MTQERTEDAGESGFERTAEPPRDALPEGVEPEEAVEGARDATSWAKRVSTLMVTDVPEGALNLNVEGRRLTSPIQGFGQMWQKTYQVRIPGDRVSPPELISTWKKRFPEFWPRGNRFFAPLTGIAPGEVALLDLALPGHIKLSTGVLVLYADEESFTLMTPQGHVFAGWITFSATKRDGETVAQAQVLMRASDPIYELGAALGGHSRENHFWEQTLARLAAHFGHEGEVAIQVICVDRKRQWSRWTNVWYSAAVRSAVHGVGERFRLVSRQARRQRLG
jgi:hypothetical protein